MMELDKKILIDLFKNKTVTGNPVDFKGNYYSDHNIGFEKGCGIEFNPINDEAELLNELGLGNREEKQMLSEAGRRKNNSYRSGDVFLAIGEFGNNYFISFNSFKTQITKEEYSELIDLTQNRDEELELNHNIKLLKLTLGLEAKKQARKTLTEKNNAKK